jgi:hypothetical protein
MIIFALIAPDWTSPSTYRVHPTKKKQKKILIGIHELGIFTSKNVQFIEIPIKSKQASSRGICSRIFP